MNGYESVRPRRGYRWYVRLSQFDRWVLERAAQRRGCEPYQLLEAAAARLVSELLEESKVSDMWEDRSA